MTGLFGPKPTIRKGECGVFEVLLDNVEQFGVFDCAHEQDLRGLKHRDLGHGLDVILAVAYLA